jgi:hypothetical protein
MLKGFGPRLAMLAAAAGAALTLAGAAQAAGR